MSRVTSYGTTLSDRYAVGELAEFVGVPDYYDAGFSKWVKTGVWIASTLLAPSVRLALSTGGYDKVALSGQTLFTGVTSPILNAMHRPATLSGIAVYPFTASNTTTAARALVISSAGMQLVTTGQTCSYATAGTAGGGHVITSDGTTLWSWTVVLSTGMFAVYSSTNGSTWTSRTMTGQAVTNSTTMSSYMIGCGLSQATMTRSGDANTSSSAYHAGAYWCGARHLLIGIGTSGGYMTAQRSADGVTWGGDETVAILGGNAASSTRSWFYRNGNSALFTQSTLVRSTIDGGITWTTPVNAVTAQANVFRVNATDPARIVSNNSGSDLRFSTDSGATWTIRVSPITLSAGSATVFGRGSTWAICESGNAVPYVTTNDGATWTALNAPIGFIGAIQAVYADAYRWYAVSALTNQVAVSTDLSNWTVSTVRNAAPGTAGSYTPRAMVSTDSQTVMGAGDTGVILYSVDGGVNWDWATPSNNATFTAASANFYVANTVGTPAFISGPCALTANMSVIPASALSTGGLHRATATAITPIRTGTLVYNRIF